MDVWAKIALGAVLLYAVVVFVSFIRSLNAIPRDYDAEEQSNNVPGKKDYTGED